MSVHQVRREAGAETGRLKSEMAHPTRKSQQGITQFIRRLHWAGLDGTSAGHCTRLGTVPEPVGREFSGLPKEWMVIGRLLLSHLETRTEYHPVLKLS